MLANQEENRELDVRRLRAAGVPVWVTRTESVPETLASLRRLCAEALAVEEPGWLTAASTLWAEPLPRRARVVVPIWRDPWMAVGRSTFTGDLLRYAGLVNLLDGHAGRYPHVDLTDLDRPDADLVLLPDEPYRFTADDGPEAFVRPTRLVSGRLLTWYGPSLVEAHPVLTALSGGA